jgi:hypothetical protein
VLKRGCDRFAAIGRCCDYGDLIGAVQQLCECSADEGMIVGDYYADHGDGITTVIVVPRPGAESISSVPPA